MLTHLSHGRLLIMAGGPRCVDYYPGWVDDADRLFGVLQDQIVWEQHAITLVRAHRADAAADRVDWRQCLSLLRHRE